MEHLDEARDRVLMGPARTGKDLQLIRRGGEGVCNEDVIIIGGRIPDELTNKNTAYHEAGHTLVAYYTKCAMPLHKVSEGGGEGRSQWSLSSGYDYSPWKFDGSHCNAP